MSSVRTLVAGIVVVLAVTVSCTSSLDDTKDARTTPTPSAATSSSAPPSDEPVTLRFGVYGDEATVAAYRELADRFQAEHPNVTVEVEAQPDAGTAMRVLEGQVAHRTAPDVFLADQEQLPHLVTENAVQPLAELLEERGVSFGDGYQRVGLEAFSANSALQCMPYDVSPQVVYYNSDLLRLRKLAAPGEEPPTPEDGWTWDEFTRAARTMSTGRVKGLFIEPSLRSLTPLVRSAGTDVMDDDRTPTSLTMSDSDTRSALEQVLKLVRDPHVTPTTRELARMDPVTMFEKGRLGMMVGSRALLPRLRTAHGLRFDVMPLPSLGRFTTASTMTGYCISEGSTHVDAAADFLAFAISRQGASITTRPGQVVPANLAVAHSPAFLQPSRQPKHAFVFIDGARRSSSPPFVEDWSDMVRVVDPLVERLFTAPVLDLDTLLPLMDEQSRAVLSPDAASPSPQ